MEDREGCSEISRLSVMGMEDATDDVVLQIAVVLKSSRRRNPRPFFI